MNLEKNCFTFDIYLYLFLYNYLLFLFVSTGVSVEYSINIPFLRLGPTLSGPMAAFKKNAVVTEF